MFGEWGIDGINNSGDSSNAAAGATNPPPPSPPPAAVQLHASSLILMERTDLCMTIRAMKTLSLRVSIHLSDSDIIMTQLYSLIVVGYI